MAFTVEKGIPLPQKNKEKVAGLYPFLSMEVGDSFFVPADPPDYHPSMLRNRLSCAGRYYKPKLFTVRKVDGGFRVWRTA